MSDDNPNPPPHEESPPLHTASVSPPPPPPQQPVEVESDVAAKVEEGKEKEEAPPPRRPPRRRLSDVLKSESSTSAEKDEPPAAVEAAGAESEQKNMTEEVTSREPVASEEKGDGSPEKTTAAADVRVVSSSKQETEAELEKGKEKTTDERKVPEQLVSFKEESNMVADLSDSERKPFQELKLMVEDALKSQLFTTPQKASSESAESGGPRSSLDGNTQKNQPQDSNMEEKAVRERHDVDEVSIWGIPLLKDDRSDVILLKFLRAREFKVKDAFSMLKNTIQWRREFGIDEPIDEDLGDDLEKVVFMHGCDRDGHPVCYNVYGEFQNSDLYQKTFGDEEKREKFLRWRIQFLERSIRNLDFSPGGINTIFQVNDLKNSPGLGKRELRLATKQALHILQDNYPEFVAKQVFINVPWWHLAFYTMISPFLTQRTKSKFVFAGPSKTAETLFKYISPEQVPVQYGGLSVDYCDCNSEFAVADPATEMTVKPGTKQTIEIIMSEKCVLLWELRVVGWEVSYGAEFVPNDKRAYTMIIQKPIKMASSDEPVVSNSFNVTELGRLLLTIDNPTSKKKKLLYRFKVNPLNG